MSAGIPSTKATTASAGLPASPSAVAPLPEEMQWAHRWVTAKLEGAAPPPGEAEDGLDAEPLFSFVYDGQPSSACLQGWALTRQVRDLDAHRVEHTLTYRDPATGLTACCVGVAWKAWPVVEWTVYLRNGGSADTPVVESLQALDTRLGRGEQGESLLHHHCGDDCTIDAFAPRQTVLGPGATAHFAAARGRPTSEAWPYFNLERPAEGRGVIFVVGWPGQWACTLTRDSGTGLRVCAGQELTRFRLRPGEEVRTPLIALLLYRGSWLRAQNLWRRWMLEHNLPKDHGRPLAPKMGAASVQYCAFNSTQEGDLEFIRCFLDKGKPNGPQNRPEL